MRRFRGTISRSRSRRNGPLRIPLPATSASRRSRKAGRSTPSGWRSTWGSTHRTWPGSANWESSRCARQGWWWIPGSTRSAGHASRHSTTCSRTCRSRVPPSNRRWTATSPRRGRRRPTWSDDWRSSGCGAKRRPGWARPSTSGSSTTGCWRVGACRSPSFGGISKRGWTAGPPRAEALIVRPAALATSHAGSFERPKHREQHRHHQQRHQSGDDQSTDHGQRERSLQLGPGAETQR